ncbi:MAG TPA: DUF1761 domain-containing protein [Terriglobales bacterium]|nr:DUF1761 domain-containing protein [Terriglobales bacterium]
MKRRINVVAVVVAAIVHFGLGAAWFTAFARPWMAGLRMSDAELNAAQQNISPMPYLVAFLCNLILAYAIAWILTRTERQDFGRGLFVGSVAGVIAAAAMMTHFAFAMNSAQFSVISAGYPLVGCIIMGGIIGAWTSRQRVEEARKASA